MRMTFFSIMGAAALATFVAGSAITAQPRRAPATAPLFPLSEHDLNSTSEMGCECSFRAGRRDLMRVIGNELTIRTRGGRQVCRITEAQFSDLVEARQSATCAGLRLRVRRTGRIIVHEASDSSDGPAALSIGEGRVRRTVAGRWGCAC